MEAPTDSSLKELSKMCFWNPFVEAWSLFLWRTDKKMSFRSITQGLLWRDLQSCCTSAYRLIMLNICLYSSSILIFMNDCLEPSFNPEQPLYLWSLWGMVAGLGYKSQKKWKISFGALKAKGLSWGWKVVFVGSSCKHFWPTYVWTSLSQNSAHKICGCKCHCLAFWNHFLSHGA